MEDSLKKPAWAIGLQREDRPPIDKTYRPEEGPLEGRLAWQGEMEDQQGEAYHMFVICEANTGLNVGVSERAALRPLRQKPVGTLVFLQPEGKTDLGDGRTMWRIALYCAPPSAQRTRNGNQAPPAADSPPF